MAAVSGRRGSVDGIETRWVEAPVEGPHAPVLYVHGVPTAGWEWRGLLERTGGYAPDLPGFGDSDKPATFDHSIEGYGSWLRAFADQRGLERFSLVVHDWGAVGLALAQAAPERLERLVIACAVPFFDDHSWHFVARQWRRPLIGELAMGFTFKPAMRAVLDKANREPLPREFVDKTWDCFDHGTQRAILKLYRSASPAALGAAGRDLAKIDCPTLVLYGDGDPFLPTSAAQRYADAIGPNATARVLERAGHWPWHDDPSVDGDIADFVTAGPAA